MQNTPTPQEPEAFLNNLLRMYIVKLVSKYFETKTQGIISFQKKDKYIWTLEVENLKIQPILFYENYLPLELRYSHIDKLNILINDADYLDIKVIMDGIYLDLTLIDTKTDELQERLRWIGVIFESASNEFNETGNNFLKTKLRIIFQNKLWNKINVIL